MEKKAFVQEHLKPLILALSTKIIDVRYEDTDGFECVVIEYNMEDDSIDRFLWENDIYESRFNVKNYTPLELTKLILEYV
ncbi:MAG: hypothetical protein ACI4Q4_09815 [Oscillospiraceae bacterium]